MPHVVEQAKTARSKCRGCKQAIEKGAVRIGIAVPNAFGSGESLQYFHAECAVERRSEAALVALAEFESSFEASELERLRALAAIGVEHPRWTRVNGVERDPSGRAKCRHCRETVEKGAARITLEFSEEGMVNAAGFLHPRCAKEYLGSLEGIAGRLRRSGADETLVTEVERDFAS